MLHVSLQDFFLSSFLQYISSEVNPPSDESDSSSAPSKEQLEQEKQLLLSFKPVMQKFLHDHVDLQVSALYALQVHCYNNNFPKGTCIRFCQDTMCVCLLVSVWLSGLLLHFLELVQLFRRL